MSTSTFLFPDVNVWLALAHEIHPHHSAATAWEENAPNGAVLCFCRFTQLGLLRMLTNRSAMGEDVLTQSDAWAVYDEILRTRESRFVEEPAGIDPIFRQHTDRSEISTKQWADGYLAAFAATAKIRLVTLDRALAGRVKGAVLLS